MKLIMTTEKHWAGDMITFTHPTTGEVSKAIVEDAQKAPIGFFERGAEIALGLVDHSGRKNES